MQDELQISWATEDEVRLQTSDACAVGYAQTNLWDFKGSIPRVNPGAVFNYTHVLVAKKDGKRVGTMFADFPLSTSPDGEWSSMAMLQFVYPMCPPNDIPVSPEESREIYKAMVKHFLAETKKHNFAQVAVINIPTDDPGLISLLKEAGFATQETRLTMTRKP